MFAPKKTSKRGMIGKLTPKKEPSPKPRARTPSKMVKLFSFKPLE